MRNIFFILIIILFIFTTLFHFILFSQLENHILTKKIKESQKKEIIISKSLISKKLNSIKTIFIVFSISINILNMVVIFLLLIATNNSTKTLTNTIKIVNSGDFNIKIPIKGKSKINNLYSEFNKMIKFCRKKISIQKYVSKSTTKMLENLKTGEFTSSPQRKDITIFFSDVRGFTAYSNRHDPLHVVSTINKIFDIQVEIIAKHEGDIDKFIGDEIMTVFPTPTHAFKAAIEIQKKIANYNKNRKEKLYLGIGIHYGKAVSGAIGSGDSYDWTIIGDTVNIGKRLCSAAESERIYLSEEVLKRIKTSHKFTKKNISMKGIAEKMDVFICS